MKNKAHKKQKILLVIKEPIGNNLNAMGIRYLEFAKFLAERFTTRLTAPCSGGNLEQGSFEYIPYKWKDCFRLVLRSDVVISTNPHPMLLFAAVLGGSKIVLDLYDPTIIEHLERIDSLSVKKKMLLHSIYVDWIKTQIKYADHYLCAHERQRDFWLGMLAMSGKLNPRRYSHDKRAAQIIAMVPTGVPDAPPIKSGKAIREKFKGVCKNDRILLWVGAPNHWYDQELLINAVADIGKLRDDIKLIFVCGNPQNSDILKKDMELCKTLGVLEKTVFFVDSWLSKEELSNYYLESDMGVSLHHCHLETRFSMRNRILGYLWGGLPVIVTEGDYAAEIVRENGWGIVVKEHSKMELVAAIQKLVDDKTYYDNCKSAIKEQLASYRWSTVLLKLEEVIMSPLVEKRCSRLIDFVGLLIRMVPFVSKYLYFRVRYGPIRDVIRNDGIALVEQYEC